MPYGTQGTYCNFWCFVTCPGSLPCPSYLLFFLFASNFLCCLLSVRRRHPRYPLHYSLDSIMMPGKRGSGEGTVTAAQMPACTLVFCCYMRQTRHPFVSPVVFLSLSTATCNLFFCITFVGNDAQHTRTNTRHRSTM